MAYLRSPAELEPYDINVIESPQLLISPPDRPQLSSVIGTGSGIISGDITVAGGLPVSSYAVLIYEPTGMPIGYAPIEPGTGHYSFVEIAPGNYAVAIIDGTGSRRAKVMHTILP